MKIYNIIDKQQYLKEVATLEFKQWGKAKNKKEMDDKINQKINKIINNFDNPYFCKLILLDDDKLVGFISIFEHEKDVYLDLKPWYATMYIKKEYRNKGYSKILNEAILKEANRRGFSKLYLKSYLKEYYLKFNAVYLRQLENGEYLFYMNTN